MNFPDGFVAKYQQLMGTEADDFLASFDAPAQNGFRVNPNRQLGGLDLDRSQPVAYAKPWGFLGQVSGRSLAHQTGSVYSQEPSAMFVGAVAAPKPGERVLDLCAAPGGKTTHLASYLAGDGILVTNEINRKRVGVLGENVERFGVRQTVILNESPERLSPVFPDYFDTILVDAPCSGEGMFRKDPAAMVYWTPEYPLACAARQRDILTEAIKMVKPGGQLVYSTCTFAPEEDEQMMAWVLQTFPDMTLLPITKCGGIEDGRPQWADGNPELAKTARLFPHRLTGEGHFVAKLQKAEAATPGNAWRQPAHAGKRLTTDQVQAWEAFQAATLTTPLPGPFVAVGDQLFLGVKGLPDLRSLHVFRPGLHLGTFKKHRFEPSYALALTLDPTQVKQQLAISIDEWRQVVHGDTLTLATEQPKGWYLLTCAGNPVAFGKLVGRTVKNFFPKGLRFTVYPQ